MTFHSNVYTTGDIYRSFLVQVENEGVAGSIPPLVIFFFGLFFGLKSVSFHNIAVKVFRKFLVGSTARGSRRNSPSLFSPSSFPTRGRRVCLCAASTLVMLLSPFTYMYPRDTLDLGGGGHFSMILSPTWSLGRLQMG